MSTDDEALAPTRPSGDFVQRWWVGAVLIFILACAAFVRIRLIDLPLERDEGEYAYAGQLMLQGIPPYQLAYNMKLPGTYAVYALIMAGFGQTTRGIHIGLILANSITTFLVYLLGRRLFGPICGVVAAGCFAFLSLSYSVLGLAAHATHFVTLFGVAGTLLLWRAIEEKRLAFIFWSGLLFGLSFVMKQQAVFLSVFGGLMITWHELRRRPFEMRSLLVRGAVFSLGALLPFVSACAALAAAGVFSRFWFWTFSYARQYAGMVPLSSGWSMLQNAISLLFRAAPALWLLAGLGLTLVTYRERDRHKIWFALAFLAASFAMACPGLFFREHYFIPLLPAVAIFTGAAIQILSDEIRRRKWSRACLAIPVALFLAASGHAIARHGDLFFRSNPRTAARDIYGGNPFPEAVEIARYIRENTAPGSRIAILGSEPEIYFYSGRHSATGYIYIYPLMEAHKYALTMQQEMITEIESAKPEYFVLVDVVYSWLPRPTSHRLILEWFNRYAQEHLEQVGFVDIISMIATEYHLGDWEGKYSQPKSQFSVTIFKRKTNS